MGDQHNNQDEKEFIYYEKYMVPPQVETNWNHIKRLKNLEVRHKESIHDNNELLAFKYMSANRIIESIKNNEFVFVSPEKWRDPYETLFYNPSKEINGKFYNVKAACFALNHFENEEGMWHFSPFSSPDNNNPTVRVAFKIEKLIDSLKHHTDEHFYIYLADVIYNELKEDYNIFSPSTIDDYIKHLLYKRIAYQHENELRLFAVKDSDIEIKDDGGGLLKLKVDDMSGIISKVTLPPIDTLVDGKRLCKDCYHALLESSNKDIKKQLEELHIHVGYSHLYDLKVLENKGNQF